MSWDSDATCRIETEIEPEATMIKPAMPHFNLDKLKIQSPLPSHRSEALINRAAKKAGLDAKLGDRVTGQGPLGDKLRDLGLSNTELEGLALHLQKEGSNGKIALRGAFTAIWAASGLLNGRILKSTEFYQDLGKRGRALLSAVLGFSALQALSELGTAVLARRLSNDVYAAVSAEVPGVVRSSPFSASTAFARPRPSDTK